jgi:predicted anti-sigma-YlaC factor YlaD
MRCSEIQRKLSPYIDNEMTDPQKKEIKNHLAICENCQRDYQDLLESWELLDALPKPEPAPFLYTRIQTRLSEKSKGKQYGRLERFFVPLSATAAVIIGIVIGSIVGANGEVSNTVSTSGNGVVSPIDLSAFDDMPESSLGQIYYDFTGLQEQEGEQS